MVNYYEFLEIQSSASEAEIGAAIDFRYNQVRRLVSHHDVNVVNQANQALAVLEEARAILLDPNRRASYDLQLQGGAATVGGLADPASAPPAGAPVPGAQPAGFPGPVGMPVARPVAQPAAPPSVQFVAPVKPAEVTWACPRCNSPHPVNTLFCKRCGETMGVTCPDCSRISEIGALYCSSCGVELRVAKRRKELRELISRSQTELSRVQALNPRQDEKIAELRGMSAKAWAWLITCGLASLYFIIVIFFSQAMASPVLMGVYGGLWVAQVIVIWIMAAVLRVKPGVMAGAGWANFFLLLVPAGMAYLFQQLINGMISLDTYQPVFYLFGISLFFIGLAVPRNYKNLAEGLKETASWLGKLRFFSVLAGLVLVLYPLISMFMSQLYEIASYMVSVDQISTIYNGIQIAVLLAYLFSGALFVLPGLVSLRQVSRTNNEVKAAILNQQNQINMLQTQLNQAQGELSMLQK